MGRQALPIQIFYPILAVIGVPVNLLSFLILLQGKCGLSKEITRYMMAMTVGDLMVLVFNVTVSQIVRNHSPDSVLKYTPVCRASAFLQGFSLQLTSWFTVSFTFDRFVAICCGELRLRYCTERTAAVVLTAVSLINVLTNIPLPFGYEPCFTVNRVQYGCCTTVGSLASPVWAAHRWVTMLSTTFLPIPALLLLNSLTARHILVASRARRALRIGRRGDPRGDPELKGRRTSIVLLFAVSGSFIAMSAPISVIHAWVGVTETVTFKGSSSLYLAVQITFLLMCTGSCTNTCVYALTQSRFRAQMKAVVKSPFAPLIKQFSQ
ncbi:probable G-protein coupled receptor 139 [Pristis pectinata]|uniref:probable G-protein coupled receptor 139 n=1 Tax=Pristis pectinata TaxID=685728 RepID=UPI00223D86D3|nr:probable G-protein coupled receptor 139 [Pristis pectinata]